MDVIEPQLNHDPRVLLALLHSLRAAEVHSHVTLHAGFSPAKVEALAEASKRWSLIFIDGNHNGDYPLQDAIVASLYAEDDAMVFFHDLVFPDVARGRK